MIHYGVCQVCSLPVTSAEGRPAFRVQGYEVLRAAGGTNHIRNRERVPNKVWHEQCLPPERMAAGQTSLMPR